MSIVQRLDRNNDGTVDQGELLVALVHTQEERRKLRMIFGSMVAVGTLLVLMTLLTVFWPLITGE